MESIPQSWPPEEPRERVVPLFPLPHVWLFPYVLLPLHIFEERYRQMIEDGLDGPGRLVLGTVKSEHEDELAGSPPVYSIAGLGEIGRHERLEDGRYNILLVGLKRVRIREVASDKPYRRVAYEPVNEIAVPEDKEEKLRTDLVAGILERTNDPTAIPPGISPSLLADMLILRMPLPHDVLNELYCELDAEKRARAALEQHKIRPQAK